MTLRVGIETTIPAPLLRLFPAGTEIISIPPEIPPDTPIQTPVDLWIPSLSAARAREQWPHLRGVGVVQSLFAGVDGLLKFLPGTVTLCDARGVHDIPIAEWAVAAILAMQKYFPFYLDLQHRHDWSGRERAESVYLLGEGTHPDPHSPVLVGELAGSTVLILGYGSIGAAIEARLAPFGVNILRVARSARPGVSPIAALDDLLPAADIVVAVLPSTSETHGLLNRDRLTRMKRGALLVNAGRGTTVDTAALLAALTSGHLRAALDVVDPEPLPPDHPLWSAPNLLLTPHVAGDSPRFLERAVRLAADQAGRLLAGQPLLNVVTGEY